MSKNLEIERKFILKNLPYFNEEERKNVEQLGIGQTYLVIDDTPTRFRKTCHYFDNKIVYHQCIKKSIGHGTYEEIETEVTEEVYKMSLNQRDRYLTKTRHVYKANGLKWEIDDYHGIQLVTLEVELDDINQEIEIPEVIKEQIICEVTGMKGFTNYNIAEENG